MKKVLNLNAWHEAITEAKELIAVNELSSGAYKNAIKAGIQRGDSKGQQIAITALQSFTKEVLKELASQEFIIKASRNQNQAVAVANQIRRGDNKNQFNQFKLVFTGEGSMINDKNISVVGSDEVHFNAKAYIYLPDTFGGWASDLTLRGYQQHNHVPVQTLQFSIKNGRVWIYFRAADADFEFTRPGARMLAQLADIIAQELEFPTKVKHNSIKQFDAVPVSANESYDGNMSDFKQEYPVRFEEVTGNSEKAIKKISKAGKGYEVRTSTYMSQDELAKVGDAMGLELKSYEKSSSVVVAIYEARDLNDPVLLRMRAAASKRDAAKNAPKEPAKKEMSPAKAAKLRKLQAERAQLMRDMEQEAEMEGGPIADRYGKMLDKIDKEIAKLHESVEVNEANDFAEVSDKFKEALDNLPEKKFTRKNIEDLIKKFKEKRPDSAMAYAEKAFGWLMKEDVNEARSINKIKKEWDSVSKEMAEVVKTWKSAEGSKKESYLEKLKALTAKKKDLEKELNAAVKGKDRNVELAASESLLEGGMSEIDIIAKTAKNFNAFVKEVIADFKLEDTKELRDWLETIYAPYSK